MLDYAQPGEVFAFVGSSYGRGYVRMVTAIGPNPERDSDLYVLDLSYDPRELAALNDEGLQKRLSASPRPARPPARQRRAVLLGRLADARLQILDDRIFYDESPEVTDEL